MDKVIIETKAARIKVKDDIIITEQLDNTVDELIK